MSAARLRRSAVAERIRLRAEWAELKGTDSCADVLRGVVALVEVGPGSKTLALRAALNALGATVVLAWTPLVTHVVWAEGGCRTTRARARALACRLVSPLWVEACAARGAKLSERAFPAATRASDVPSPRRLRQMLKVAEKENFHLDLLCTLTEDERTKLSVRKPTQQLRISSDKDTSEDEAGVPTKVNTAPRRVVPADSAAPPPPATRTSRRKLFTNKEAEMIGTDDDDDDEVPARPKPRRIANPAHIQPPTTPRERRDLKRAERMARRMAQAAAPATVAPPTQYGGAVRPRIVLTGMSSTERRAVFDAVKKLNGKVLKHVSLKTTHIILGACGEDNQSCRQFAHVRMLGGTEITGVEGLSLMSQALESRQMTPKSLKDKPRTLNALEGAARGCRVLTPAWALHSAAAGHWLPPHLHEVPHLRKLSQRARIERSALCLRHKDYACNIFHNLIVDLTETTQHRDSARTLLELCGAKISQDNPDITVGGTRGQVGSKWVFDSVASARVRNTRRYIVDEDRNEVDMDEVRNEIVVDEVRNEIVVDDVINDIDVDEVRNEIVVDEVRNEIVVDEVRNEIVVDEVRNEIVVDEVRNEIDVDEVRNEVEIVDEARNEVIELIGQYSGGISHVNKDLSPKSGLGRVDKDLGPKRRIGKENKKLGLKRSINKDNIKSCKVVVEKMPENDELDGLICSIDGFEFIESPSCAALDGISILVSRRVNSNDTQL